MTVIDIQTTPVQVTSDEDELGHYICCEVETAFEGVTMGFCGAPVLCDKDDEDLVVESVDCQPCNEIASVDGCPFYGFCQHDEED
jgi:hypothetical protein